MILTLIKQFLNYDIYEANTILMILYSHYIKERLDNVLIFVLS